jgi:8-oxo-dGTP pyrophosphatase MutT (NUDIX family)
MANVEVGYQRTTIVFPQNTKGILLGMKKRGFGEGWWNGFGGKLLNNESYEDSARRETLEEVGLHISNLLHLANLHFYFDGALGVVSRAYSCDFTGEPAETEEMRPQLFQPNQLPFNDMWPADRLWIPKVLSDTANYPLGFIIHFNGDKTFKSMNEVEAIQLEGKF